MYNAYRNTGMTLVELLVLISIYTVLVLAITRSIQAFYQYNSYTIAQAEEVNSARRGLDRLIADARELTEGEDGSYPIRITEPYRFGFFSDVDRDADVEYVEFELATTTLIKRVHAPTGNPPVYNFGTPDEVITVSTEVRNFEQGAPVFTYIDDAQSTVTSTSSQATIRFIRFSVIVNIDPIRSPGEFMLRSSVAPRNLKDNL